MSQSLGISLRAVEKQLSKLKESGHLRRVGSARGGYWEIVEYEKDGVEERGT